ncbi:MCE family protein [Amycolatopsis acidicola]|uniref:MCE family protein n=1 Tax=Amycolatopsis acidicola TaxID=2596893 RepID=A0A5N0UQF2_9PSEU|nr:MCE family protein [Amycolatopsis acidicola]KAA9152315.1 MCE family protein [Amycolatopsis acidicola]
MPPQTRRGQRIARAVAAACALALVLTGGLWWVLRDRQGTQITAYFTRAVGLYAGSAVRVLGMEVGTVDDVRPDGARVRVRLTVDRGVQIPQGATATVVAPNLVADRYVQFVPAYTDGPTMAGGTVLPENRTVTPVELDDLYANLDKLSTVLGPDGANKNGALSGALDAAAANLGGNGETLSETIRKLGDAAATLTHSQGDLFSTVDSLQKFTSALAQSDAQMRSFDTRLADVSGYLAQDKQDLGQALSSMSTALTQVQGFVQRNQGLLESNVHNLSGITQALVDQRAALAEVLDTAPLAASNMVNAYDATTGTYAVRGSLNELTYPPVTLLCRLIKADTPKQLPQTLNDICAQLAPVIDGTAGLPSAAQALGSLQNGQLPPLPLPVVSSLGIGR